RLSAWSRSKLASAPAASSSARIGRLQAIADAADGGHDRTGGPAAAELVPQPVHVLGDGGLALPALGAAPHLLKQLGAGEHLPGVPGEERQQVEFLGREVDRA